MDDFLLKRSQFFVSCFEHVRLYFLQFSVILILDLLYDFIDEALLLKVEGGAFVVRAEVYLKTLLCQDILYDLFLLVEQNF